MTTPREYLPLGTRVTATDRLVRRTVALPGPWKDRKEWVRSADQWPGGRRKPEPVSGVVVGVRTLANGTRHWGDESISFHPTERLTVYLIAYDLHRVPAYALVEDVTPEVSRG